MYIIYMYEGVTLLYSRNWHKTVNQLYLNLKNRKKKREKEEHKGWDIYSPSSENTNFHAVQAWYKDEMKPFTVIL